MSRRITSNGLLGLLVAGLCGVTTYGEEASGDARPARGRTLLFVDDHDVLYRAGTRREVHPAKRHGPPIVAEDKPWEVTIAWCSVYRNPQTGKYQLWYQGYAGATTEDKRLRSVVCYAESDDGVTFVKPELELHPFGDVKRTNIVLVGNGAFGERYCNSVLVDERETDPAKRYKMAYYDWTERGDRYEDGLHVAFSPDGIHWTKHAEAPLYVTRFGARGAQPALSDEDPYVVTPVKGKPPRREWRYGITMSDAVDVFYDPRRQTYAIYGKSWMDSPLGGGAWKHGLARTESKDFLHWSPAEFLLGPDDRDPPELEFHTSPVFMQHDVYLCPNQILDRRRGGTMYIELMTSRDGANWLRDYRDVKFLDNGPTGEFDGGCVFTNSTPVVLDDEIRLYYGGYSSGAVGGGAAITGPEQKSGVGFATIPRDRFAGIRTLPQSAEPTLRKPVEHVGQVTLKPLDLAGCTELTLNADAKEGKLFVELLTADGRRVRGYTKDDAVPLAGDSLRHAVAWKERRLANLPPGRYLLRIHLERATLYAATFR